VRLRRRCSMQGGGKAVERERREPDETVLGQVIHGWIEALLDRALQTYHGELPRYEQGCIASARVLIPCPYPCPCPCPKCRALGPPKHAEPHGAEAQDPRAP